MKNLEDTVHIEYKTLFIICRYCLLISILLIPISIVVFLKWPLYPDNIIEIMANNKIGGILSLDSIYTIGTFVSIPMLLFYYLTTKTINKSLSLIALTLGVIGLICLYCSRPIIEMVQLAQMYENSDNEMTKNLLKEMSSIFMLFFRGTSFNIHYLIGNISLLITSFLMRNNKYYNKAISNIGIVTLLFSFCYYIPIVGIYISTISVIGYIAWWLLTIFKINMTLQKKI